MLRTERRCFVEYDCPTAVQEALDLSGASGIWHGGAQLRVDKRHSPTKPRKSPEESAREEERKRDPRYKTELCRNLPSCRHGATCTFAHRPRRVVWRRSWAGEPSSTAPATRTS